jgi:hypothetical protein
MDKLGELVQSRIRNGAEIRPLHTPDAGPHPWSQDAGYLRGNRLVGAWRKAMEEYRRQLDEDPDGL